MMPFPTMVVGSDVVKSCALTKGPKKIKHRADNNSASECPDNDA
jgi:hypothetical protein